MNAARPAHPAHFPGRTLAAPIIIDGHGLFTGAPVQMRIEPADDGITFVHPQAAGGPLRLPALASSAVVYTGRHHTVLQDDSQDPRRAIVTVEHVMSALAGLGITSAIVHLDASEPPMMDGSAAPLAQALLAAGLRPASHAPLLHVQENVCITDDRTGVTIEASPRDDNQIALTCEYHLDYAPSPDIPTQAASFTLSHTEASAYVTEIAPARTFCTAAEADHLRRLGHFGHVRAGDVLVMSLGQPSGTAMRFIDEPARHKVLDIIGDLALTGRRIVGAIRAHRTGHAMNLRFARELLARFA